MQGAIFLVIAAISALYWRRPAIFMYVLLGTLLADLLSLVIRYAVGRDRPPIDYPEPVPLVRLPDNPAFPSGHAATSFDAAVELAANYPGEMLMEQLIVGEELTVPVLNDIALPSIRIVPKGEWYDYHAKYISDDTQYLCPGLEGAEEAEIGRIAAEAFVAAGCRGWGRVDFMRDRATGQLTDSLTPPDQRYTEFFLPGTEPPLARINPWKIPQWGVFISH